MRGAKAKALRKMADSIGGDLPDIEHIERKFKKDFLINTATGQKRVTMELKQVFLGKCKRKIYKEFKKGYKRGMFKAVPIHG